MLLMSVVRFQEIIFYLCRVRQIAGLHIESVFAHPLWKMWKFSEQRDRRTTLILGIFHCDRVHCIPMSHIYTECGALESFISVQVFPQPSTR